MFKSGPISEEQRQKIAEGRKRATPKKAYGDAIQAQCEQCTGTSPAFSDCEETGCVLYGINTRAKRRGQTKTAIKKLIRAECLGCLGPDPCHSKICPLVKLNHWNIRIKHG